MWAAKKRPEHGPWQNYSREEKREEEGEEERQKRSRKDKEKEKEERRAASGWLCAAEGVRLTVQTEWEGEHTHKWCGGLHRVLVSHLLDADGSSAATGDDAFECDAVQGRSAQRHRGGGGRGSDGSLHGVDVGDGDRMRACPTLVDGSVHVFIALNG